MNKRIYIDVETTGLNPKINSIWQLAGAIELDGTIVERFHFRMRPILGKEITLGAFESKGYRHPLLDEIEEYDAIKEDEYKLHAITQYINTFMYPVAAHAGLLQILEKYISKYDKNDKAHFTAYNARFDADFIRQWFYDLNDKYYGSWFFSTPLDVLQFAAWYFEPQRAQLPNMKQGTVAKMLGILVDETRLHDAIYDVEIAQEIVRTITARKGTKEEGGANDAS